MDLTILSPKKKETMIAAWIEVNTPVGNFVIQKGHIPMILEVVAHQPVTVKLSTGKQETFDIPGGILEVTRTSALLLLNE